MARTADERGAIDLNPAKALEQLDNWLDGLTRLLPNILVAIVFVLLFWFVAQWAGALFRKAAQKRGRENLGTVIGSFLRWSVFLLAVLIALTIVMPSLSPGDLIAGLGVGSVAIGFAFKDILQNWLAGILILLRQPFEIDDQIVVGDFEGAVERIESRATIIKTYDNQRIVIPNAEIYTDAVLVRTANKFRRSQYDIGIGYGDDLDEACSIIRETISSIDGVHTDPGPEALVWGLDASWITIRARWWTNSDRASVVTAMARILPAIKNALDDAGIDMPFETQIQLFHDQTEEVDGDRSQQREGWPAGGRKMSDVPRSRRDADIKARPAES